MRKEKAQQNAALGIYPSNYDPFAGYHNRVHGEINFSVGWVEDSQFYVCNPYLLVIFSIGDYITPIIKYCEKPMVRYTKAAIVETYEGKDAAKLMGWLLEGPDNAIRLWLINAADAGFRYSSVDLGKSENIEMLHSPAGYKDPPANVYVNGGVFHVGRYKKNNLSLRGNLIKVKLQDRRNTQIYVKLWRRYPPDASAKEDLAYVIKILL